MSTLEILSTRVDKLPNEGIKQMMDFLEYLESKYQSKPSDEYDTLLEQLLVERANKAQKQPSTKVSAAASKKRIYEKFGWKIVLNRREQALENGTSVGRPAKSVLAKYHR